MSRDRALHACTIPALLVFAFAALLWLLITQTTADADLWGHLRFGSICFALISCPTGMSIRSPPIAPG